jgi:AAA family ATP:ADP antiporter
MKDSMDSQDSQQFSRLRRLLWPIHRHEMGRLVPMFLISFLTCFNYSLLRTMKDAQVITACDVGAEVIPYLKGWIVLPAALIATILFSFLARRFSRHTVFYLLISSFIAYFLLFLLVLFPNLELLTIDSLATWGDTLPKGFRGFIAIFRYWPLSSFYIASELWGSIVLGILFWGFVNEVTKMSEARRFYGFLGFGSNLAAVGAGVIGLWLTRNSTPWATTLSTLTTVVIVSGLAIMALYWWINHREPDLLQDTAHTDKKKKSFSIFESFAYLKNSPYLLRIAILVLAYNLSINLVEVIWKGHLKELYPNPEDYFIFMSWVTVAVGSISCMAAMMMSGILKRLGWTLTALITPCILLVTSLGFFSTLYLSESLLYRIELWTGLSVLSFIVLCGAAQNSLSKAAKYSVFDTTKELSFIPLDSEAKMNGKAAIDGVGSRLGKSGGSFIQQGLLISLGSLSAITPFVAVIVIGLFICWFYAVQSLGRRFQSLESELKAVPVTAEPALEKQAI